MSSHFDLFGLPPAYALDVQALEQAYHAIQARVHPDRHAASGEAERRASLQWTTRVNQAFRTLKDPVARAAYLLELHGVDVAFETNTAMPAEFLTRQLELREALEQAAGARDTVSLERLRRELRAEARALEAALAARIDAERDYAGAAGLARELKFLARLDEEIDTALADAEA